MIDKPVALVTGSSRGIGRAIALELARAGYVIIVNFRADFAAAEQTRTLIEDDFINLWRESRMTALFVTHDLAEAIAMCTRVVIISARPGRVKSEYEITLPFHQSTTERRLEPEFQDFYSSIWADLREEVGTRLE